jgi:cell wall-associated NlpC family hydrolase
MSVVTVVVGVLLLPAPFASASPRPAPKANPLLQGDEGGGPPAPWEQTGRSAAQAASCSTWKDVPATHWANSTHGCAINVVGKTNDWMRDYGPATFKPGAVETRKLFARAMVRMFAPDEPINPAIRFADLPADDPFYPYANVAVKKRWMTKSKGKFFPEGGVKTVVVHRAIVWALGLSDEAAGFQAMHFSDGTRLDMPKSAAALNLGMLLYLRFNHGSYGGTEAQDVQPGTRLIRSEVAWSLYRADRIRTSESWRVASLARYRSINIGPYSQTKEQIVEWGLRYVGYPYVYGGEWAAESPGGYCCGYQPVGGFDCTGLVWWATKKATTSWDNSPPRPYAGWDLAQRSSADMAAAAPKKLTWAGKKPGDLLFYGYGSVSHANVFVGMGWALDSSTSIAGVTFLWIGEGSWYRDTFKWGRRILTA